MHDFPAVRRARKGDQERVAALWMQFLKEQAALDARFAVADDALERWSNDFPLWIGDETRRIFVAEHGEAIVGFASAHRWGPPPIYAEASEVHVDELYVAPERRRQGLGAQLAAAVRHWAEEKLQADRLRLSVLAANEAGRAFWSGQRARAFTTAMTVELAQKAPPGERAAAGGKLGFL